MRCGVPRPRERWIGAARQMRHGYREVTGKSKHSLFKTQLLKWVGGTGTGSKYGAVYRDGSASVDPLHALVVDNSDEVWSVGGLDYLPSEGFGSDVVALDVELCRRWRSRWRSCWFMTADVNTWQCWSREARSHGCTWSAGLSQTAPQQPGAGAARRAKRRQS